MGCALSPHPLKGCLNHHDNSFSSIRKEIKHLNLIRIKIPPLGDRGSEFILPHHTLNRFIGLASVLGIFLFIIGDFYFSIYREID